MASTYIQFSAASLLGLALLAGCTESPAPSQADQANVASCTAQADAVYQQNNLNGLARTSQNGLLYAPMPNQVFDAQRMGSMNARDNQISDCVENGNPNNRPLTGAPLPAPQIIGNP